MRGLGDTFFNLQVIEKYLPALLSGFRVTLALAGAVGTLGILLGLTLAIVRAFRFRVGNWLIVAFVDLFWTLPQLVESDDEPVEDRKSTRLNSSHLVISYAVFF